MGKWNEPYNIGIALDPSKGAWGTVEYTVGPLHVGPVGPAGLPNFEGDMWGGTWSFNPEEMGFPNTDRTYEGQRVRRYYDAMGRLLDTQENVELLTINRISEADAIRYCAQDGRNFDPATSLCTGEPSPPPEEPVEPGQPDFSGLPWPIDKIAAALWFVVGPFVEELEKLLGRIFAGPLEFLGDMVDGILEIPTYLAGIGDAIFDAVSNPSKFILDPIWAKLEELGVVDENWKPPTWDEFAGFLWAPVENLTEAIAHKMGFEKQEGRGSYIWRRIGATEAEPESDLIGDIGRGLFRGITGDIQGQIDNVLKIAKGATMDRINPLQEEEGGPQPPDIFGASEEVTWAKDIDDSFKKYGVNVYNKMTEKLKPEAWPTKSPMTDADAKDMATGIATTVAGGSIALWLAHAAAEAASLGQYEALRDFDDMVIAKLGLGAFGAKILSIPLERGLFKPTEYFYNTLLTPEIPAYADLINMVVKEVLPIEDFNKQMGRLGYSKDWATKIWDAHFIPPTRTELLRAFWRGKISAEALTKLELLVDLDPRFRYVNGETGAVPLSLEEGERGDFDIWEDLRYVDPSREEIRYMFETGQIETEDEYSSYLQRLGYRDEDLERLTKYGMQFQERFFRRRYLIALAQGFRLGTVSESDLKDGFKSAHYTEAVADWVIKAEEVRKDFRGDSREREATLARALSWYVGGYIEESDLRERLEGLGYAETEIELFIDESNAKIEAKEVKEEPKISEFTRAQLDTLYKDGVLNLEDYTARMLDLGWKQEAITEWIQTFEEAIEEAESREVTTSRVLNWFKKDVLDEAETRERLTALKWGLNDVDNYILEAELGKIEPQKDILQSEAASAFRVGAIDEGTFRLRLQQLGRTTEAVSLILATEQLKQSNEIKDLSRGQYDRLFRAGLITENEYRSRLGVAGYSAEGVEYWVTLQKSEQFEKEKTLTQSQIINVWERGQKDPIWFSRVILGAVAVTPTEIEVMENWTLTRLKGLGMAEGDARILIELEREESK